MKCYRLVKKLQGQTAISGLLFLAAQRSHDVYFLHETLLDKRKCGKRVLQVFS